MELFKEYKMKNGDTIVFNGVSIVNKENGMPVDSYSSDQFEGLWNKKGKYLTNVYFLENAPSEMDVILK
jgi:hypothetical protein